MQLDLADFYSCESAVRVKNKISEFYCKLQEDPLLLLDISQTIAKISKDIKISKKATKIKIKQISTMQDCKDKIQLMNILRKEGNM